MLIEPLFVQSGQLRQARALFARLPNHAVIPCSEPLASPREWLAMEGWASIPGRRRVRVRAWNDARTVVYETFAFGDAAVGDAAMQPPLIIPAFAAKIERRFVAPDVALMYALHVVRDGDDVHMHIIVNDAEFSVPARALRRTALQCVSVTLDTDELYALIDARRAVTRVRFGARGGWVCLKTRSATLWKRNA